ncbi:MAG TPA: hypothetical protein VKB79_07115 [Bryobacteraceae bacterium]|nr:hypothetical protein [Bryobacteraceae bacterium]
MPNREPDDQLLSAALGRSNDCPPLTDLEGLLQEGAPITLKRHVEGCPHCQTELHMLRSFTSNEIAEDEQPAVNAIAARLKARPTTGATNEAVANEPRQPWWKRAFEVRWLSPAAATLAIALVVAGVASELRRGRQPAIAIGAGTTEVLRSSAITILSPIGDLRERPMEIRWEAAPNAVRYRVRIIEVDHAEVWSTDATSPRVGLPATVEALIVPSKTFVVQVAAFGASGQKIAESETARFRLLQKVYTR